MGISGRIAAYFQDSRLTPLLALVALLLGLFAILVTPREEEPQIDVTMANVLVPYPGASARDVEALVATPAEQVLSQMSDVEHVFSVSRPGMAILTVQFKVGVPRTEALVRLHDTIQANRDWVTPEMGVGEPIVKPKGIDDVPIMTLTLWTADPQRGAFELERIAHSAEVELKRVPGTREVQTLGGPGRALRVLLDPDRLNAFGISALEVRRSLELANVSAPSGSLVRDNRSITVETGSFLESAQDVAHIVLGVRNARPVFLSDVAEVVDGPEQPARYVWTGSVAGEHPAVTLQVTKKPGENAVRVAERLIERVNELRGSIIPAGVEVSVTRNYGATADEKASQLMHKLVFATLSVVVLMLFALGMREAAIVGVAVLLTLAATLFASWAWGFTLNRVSLFALIFSIGILVDDAIVVVENIHRRAQLDRAPLASVIPGAVDEVGGPTILATLTVIAALLPMAFVTGLMGPYMAPIPINSSMGMLLSLAIAFTVTPWLALRWLKHSHEEHPPPDKLGRHLAQFFTRVMTPFLGAGGGRNRLKLATGIAFAILASVALVPAGLVVMKMLPFDNKSEFQVVVDMPTGTPVETTGAVLRAMTAEIAQVPEVVSYQAYAGLAAPINFNGLVRQYYLRSGGEVGDIQVNLTDRSDRERKSHEIAQAVRPALEAVAKKHGAEVKVIEVPPGPPVLSPIVAEIYGPDYDAQMAVAKQVRGVFEKTEGIVAIDDTVENDAQRFVLRVLQNKAAVAGVAQQDVVAAMKMGLSGENVTPIHGSGAKYEIPVRITLPPERQSQI